MNTTTKNYRDHYGLTIKKYAFHLPYFTILGINDCEKKT